MSDIVDRLRLPIDADKIYDWVIKKRKETRSDLPRLGFCNDMELIDEEREEAAETITRLRAELAEAREIVKSLLDEIAKTPDAHHLLDTATAGSAFEFLAKTR